MLINKIYNTNIRKDIKFTIFIIEFANKDNHSYLHLLYQFIIFANLCNCKIANVFNFYLLFKTRLFLDLFTCTHLTILYFLFETILFSTLSYLSFILFHKPPRCRRSLSMAFNHNIHL